MRHVLDVLGVLTVAVFGLLWIRCVVLPLLKRSEKHRKYIVKTAVPLIFVIAVATIFAIAIISGLVPQDWLCRGTSGHLGAHYLPEWLHTTVEVLYFFFAVIVTRRSPFRLRPS